VKASFLVSEPDKAPDTVYAPDEQALRVAGAAELLSQPPAVPQLGSWQDPYVGLRVDVRGSRHPEEVDNDRSELVTWVQTALDGIAPGQFLLLEYVTGDDVPVEPYAQAALDPGGWCCELASAHYLPGRRCPIDEVALSERGWQVPDAETDNWWQTDVPLDAAAQLLVDGLWFGRDLTDPDRYAIRIGTFPCGRRACEHRRDRAGTLITT
jgi:hypothetical protein